MKPRGIKRELKKVKKIIAAEIAANSAKGFYAAGLASEGYTGGYRDALDDVLLLLNGVVPNRRGWFDDPPEGDR